MANALTLERLLTVMGELFHPVFLFEPNPTSATMLVRHIPTGYQSLCHEMICFSKTKTFLHAKWNSTLVVWNLFRHVSL